MKKQNKNFIYNIIYQIFIFIVPMVTTPYISRVLGVEQVGIYAFTNSIINIFMLFSMLGIANYGARTIAKSHKNEEELSVNFISIYVIQFLLNVICICIYVLFLKTCNYEYKDIMLIQTIALFSVMFDINWFFFGIEKFSITISRNIIMKLLTLVCVFIYVKTKNDLWKYTTILSLGTLLSQMYLWLRIKKYVKFKIIRVSDIKRHIKPIIILFIPVLAYSIYRIMDKTMIGLLSSQSELGYYESADKIVTIPMGIVTALGTVMLPHMSKKEENEIENEIFKTFELSFFIIIPVIIGMLFIGNNFSNIFFGTEFVKTGTIIKYLSITILFATIANVIRTNYLMPCNKDKIYVMSTMTGAILNLILNLIFIPKYGAYGACVGTIVAEFSVMLYQMLSTIEHINYKKMFLQLIKRTFNSSIIIIPLVLMEIFIHNDFTKIVAQMITSIILYLLVNYKYILYDFFGIKRRSGKI